MSNARLGRRAFLQNGALVLGVCSTGTTALLRANETTEANALKIGLVTDLHYADKPPAGTRHYRETLAKFAEASEKLKASEPDFVVELGDLIDAADTPETELRYLARIDREYAALSPDRHYVLGNHCVDTLTKEEFLGHVERERSYYAFDRGGFRFIVLDACFRSDGVPYGRKNFKWTDANVPSAELEWLEATLRESDRPAIVFAHQRLDVNDNHGVRNSADVRKILQASGRTLAVFQGHSHQNDYREIEGVHYATLAAMVEGSGAESNGYSLMKVQPTGAIVVEGFRRQTTYEWA